MRAARSRSRSSLNSGAEAVENAVKIARAATGRPAVVMFDNGFHGRTLLTMTMTSKLVYKRGFGPFAPEVYRVAGAVPVPRRLLRRRDRGARAALPRARSIRESVACVVLEPVQGEGGFVVMPEDFPRAPRRALPPPRDPLRRRRGAVRRRPHRSDVGDRALRRRARPARLREVARRRPAARGGDRARRADGRARPGGLGGTFGGNPVACAAALAVLDEVERPSSARAPRRSATGSAAAPRAHRGRAPAASARSAGSGRCSRSSSWRTASREPRRRSSPPRSSSARSTAASCSSAAASHGNVIRILVPLVATDDELDRGLAILEESLRRPLLERTEPPRRRRRVGRPRRRARQALRRRRGGRRRRPRRRGTASSSRSSARPAPGRRRCCG